MKVDEVYLTPIYSERGFSNYFADTKNGRVWSKKMNSFMSTKPNSNGYVYNRITEDDALDYRLSKFCRGKIEVNHYPNEDEKWNNGINILQMSSRKGQYRDSTRAMGKGERLEDEVVLDIYEQLKDWQQDEENKLITFIWRMCNEHDRGFRKM
ncbi:hypothetical protein FZC74_14955 [Sutcliffiella horikoshii]|uniref:Uncharacterized protein n=1 Tax=Sutcliffiella horikoshii TaxID=79883 RepID=A0AA95B553_9BACI|nr:hypothetical protein [Sutcliffiella horikoshii]TYS57726.1 hypothetical protein FZC74_14955 [Sutcliffiella horikoshii]